MTATTGDQPRRPRTTGRQAPGSTTVALLRRAAVAVTALAVFLMIILPPLVNP